ncbi:hypothetical protein [Roseateles saccharophilus]|uniref:DUF4148 domain-containing protein n=1 Tax=Roseateles saccharophilus TaxID=304 RepID=A0A4R3UWU5_ROSSA|nr:hypothetical protein [Roseateles saccharophilus]MDG0833237.1 hypothetical protein [Roseateles saccharophilus]TCU94414.1 hypothetical protein EV671_101759 [Roseateles saccharophilus]
MKTLYILGALVCGQALAQQSSPTTPDSAQGSASHTACAQAQPGHACPMHAEARTAMADPDKLLASEPTAAGPMTRSQVVAEIERARRAGEMDFAASEASLSMVRRR